VFLDLSKSFVGVSPNFDLLFEQFEILASIVYVEHDELATLERALADPGSLGIVRMPVGRSGWHSSVREQVLKQIQSAETRKALLDGGFAKGSEAFLEKSIANFRRVASRMAW
jgi:hypothetical protein